MDNGAVDHCTIAKVVLLGRAGVGKTALGRALAGLPYEPTPVTHGRHIWTLADEVVEQDGKRIRRQALLWDLAGIPGYRVLHQLGLTGTDVALVLFDRDSLLDGDDDVRSWVEMGHAAPSQAYTRRPTS